jgi:acyl-CoA thioester hydrolase
VTGFRVPLYEVDLGQAVYHGNYFHLFELAREAFLRDLGHPYRLFMDQQLHLTVVESSCTYRRSLHYDDRIEILTGISAWRTRSLAFQHRILRPDPAGGDPTLCTEAVLHLVCVNFTGKPVVLPPRFVTSIEGWVRPRLGELHRP